MKIIFFGSSQHVIPIIDALQNNYDLSLVLTTENPALPAGRPKGDLALQGDALQSYPVVKYCVENKIPYLSVSNLSDHNTKYLILNTQSPVAILADFGLIIPQSILNMFPMGIINIHPSLLPKYRGPTPVQTAILNGEKITGVTIIKLDEEVDHGPILGQEKEKILPTDTAETLYKRLFEKGANLLIKLLPDYLNTKLKPFPQNHKNSTFTEHLIRQDGFIDLSSSSLKIDPSTALRIKLKIRAYHPWPGVWTNIMINDKGLRIKLLPENKIQVEGKKPMGYKDFLNGYPQLKQQLEKLLKQLA